ncbi:PadR family transcriptional regulator [Gryllotalpicola sp.]|uniref:PadR family transcriptional regulator n=1 Tax=Gryllotalpicola sp. TaxID=1932787 RepID=UPI002636AB17|nr:PadR family transcriptional regulator [Gryllotalpicola sp.]
MANGDTTNQLRRGALTQLILAIVSKGPTYGLSIVKELRSSSALSTPEGAVYPLLSRMEEANLLASEWSLAESPHPRRYFSLTPLGAQELADFRVDWEEFKRALDGILQGSERN